MAKYFYIFLLLFAKILGFERFKQSEYIIISERMELINCCREEFITAQFANFKFNRTHTGINMTFTVNKDLGFILKANIQAYKFSSNEYRLFPMTFTQNICEVLMNNDFGLQNLYDCGNIPACPIRKGKYIACNWGPDYRSFPPHLPIGRYRIDLQFMYQKEELHTAQWYIEIKSTKFLK